MSIPKLQPKEMCETPNSVDVEEWLLEVLGKGDYLYEANNRSLSILKQLMCFHKISKKNDLLRLSDLREKIMEYQREGLIYKAATQYLGIAPSMLNTSTINNLKILTTLAQKLCLNQIPDSFGDNCYLIALMNLQQKLVRLKNECIAYKQNIFELNSSTSGETDYKQLAETNEILHKRETSSKLDEEMKMSKYFTSKNNSYKNRFAQENKKLIQIDVKSSLHHEQLKKNSHEISKLLKSTSTIQHKLSSYEKLPASFNLLNITLAEKELEKTQLEEKLNSLFNQADVCEEL
ncbi:uncharacterized protein LOC115214795 [Argonauta hians]